MALATIGQASPRKGVSRTITLPRAVVEMLARGASMAVSISGGKDSQAMLNTIAQLHREGGYQGEIYAVHASLGRAEWPQTLAHCERIAAAVGVPLVVVRRPQGDLVEEIRQRMESLRGSGKPHWPTATQRYCTADQKRDQIVKAHRQHELVIAAQGMRAEESPKRAKMRAITVAARVTAMSLKALTPEQALEAKREGQRLALDWLPLHEWTEADVWEACGTTIDEVNRRRDLYRMGRFEEGLIGFPGHPAYVFGNQRLSCALCVLASKDDLCVGARHNPELYSEYVAMERESGFSFRQDLSLETMAKPISRQQPALF